MNQNEQILLGIGIILLVMLAKKGLERKWAREEEEMERRYREADEKNKAIERAALEKQRKYLITLRNMHLQDIQEKNAEYFAQTGRGWCDEEREMREYDGRMRDRWEMVGMTPPSFAKKK